MVLEESLILQWISIDIDVYPLTGISDTNPKFDKGLLKFLPRYRTVSTLYHSITQEDIDGGTNTDIPPGALATGNISMG